MSSYVLSIKPGLANSAKGGEPIHFSVTFCHGMVEEMIEGSRADEKYFT